MKFTLLIFAILISSLHSLSAQSLYYYGYADTRVYKADTLGNVYWVKNFAGKIDSTSMWNNQLKLLEHKNDRIFIFITQCPPTLPVSSIQLFHSIVTLDTNGTVLNCVSWQELARAVYPTPFPSFDDGFRVLIEHWANYRYSSSIKVDHDGYIDTTDYSFGISHAGNSVISDIEFFRDSTFIIAAHFYSNFTTTNLTVLAKFNRKGQNFWSFHTDFSLISSPISVTTDSIGNFYLLGSMTDFGISGLFGIKGNAFGNILLTRHWPLIDDQYHSLSFRNDSLIDLFGMVSSSMLTYSEIYFDSTFHSQCIPDTLISLPVIRPSAIAGSSLQTNFATSCTAAPFSDTITVSSVSQPPINPVTYPDYCNILAVQEVISATPISVFPNPATDKLSVHCPGFTSMNISIYDVSGSEVINTLLKPAEFLDVKSLANGLYFLKVDQPGISSGTRFLIQR